MTEEVIKYEISKLEQLKKLHEEQEETHRKKNADYGDSFGISFKKFGPISALVRISDKYNRIEQLITTKERQVDDESLIDTLKDLSNYCLMTVIELERSKDRK